MVDETAKEINLGGGLNDGYGSVWYGGRFRHEPTALTAGATWARGSGPILNSSPICRMISADSTPIGDGFTFSIISGVYEVGPGYRNSKYDTGGPLGEYLGYAGPGLPAGDGTGLEAPKIALELDTYPNPGAGSICGSNSRVDDVDAVNYPVGANHIALDYWGAGSVTTGYPGSLDAISADTCASAQRPPLTATPEDWSSSQGTISFWFKLDSVPLRSR